jgi:hypothetical protein
MNFENDEDEDDLRVNARIIRHLRQRFLLALLGDYLAGSDWLLRIIFYIVLIGIFVVVFRIHFLN